MAIIQYSSAPYQNTTDTVQRILKAVQSDQGELSIPFRLAMEDIIRNVNQRDKLSIIAAVYYWFKPRFNYVYDPREIEMVKTPVRLLNEIRTYGKCCGDCDDATTFLLAAFRILGIAAKPTRVNFQAGAPFAHIFVIAWDQYGRALAVDPVSSYKTPRMLGDARDMKVGV